jgi:hypothetical protein
MAVGTTDQLILGYWKETSYGVSPANTTPLQLVRLTSESLTTTRMLKESEEIIGTRNLQGLTAVDSEAGGDINGQWTYSDYDELIAAALGCTPAWATNVALNGSVLTSFLLEKKIADIAVPTFMAYPGQVVAGMKITLKPADFARVMFSFKGKPGLPTTTVSASTVAGTAATANPVMGTATDISAFTEGGVGLSFVNHLEIDVATNVRFQRSLASLGPIGATLGKFRVTGTMEAYFQDKSLYDKFLSGTQTSLAATIGGASSKKYAISLPKVVYTGGDVIAGGLDQDFVAKLKWTAFYDSGIGGTLQFTRTP